MSCRTCLQRHQKMISTSSNHYLQKIIKQCLDIDMETDTELPSEICHQCNEKLEEFYSFKNKSLVVNSVLQSAKENGVLHLFTGEKISEGNNSSENQIILENFVPDDTEIEEITIINDELDPKNKSNLDETNEALEICEISDEEDNVDSQKCSKETPFLCYVCRDCFETKEKLLDHVKTHLTDFQNYNTSDSTTVRKIPNRKKRNENVTKVKCKICTKEMFATSLKSHLIRHSDRFKCKVCSAKFSGKVNLDIHIKSVHTDVKDTVCDICGKGFSYKGLLNVHLKSHSEIRKYKCNLCSYAGKTSSALRIHKQVHVEEATHLCDMCPKAFRSNISLNKHKRETHIKDLKYSCDQCDAMFTKNYKLVTHYRIHTGERPYSCEICDKSFKRSDALKEHQRIHLKHTQKALS